ncbi:MAG: hypothetical protein A2289_14650 [Deltaproteobacteria bacterium RIFOXYA12_FULL_58_15]|nr:MAG: hypothetical protein A2289_14650 [Deltaproteobacteria bacterium RIFOXYA12_FULL_58_15]OGR08204.1 MAG: hypothetical protein A2341_19990 [Deltaproteobacteria bacterium RIFOXYB12_FULL_58_9]
MTISYRKKPSIGFIYLVLVGAVTALFLVWGMRRPALEEVWRMDIELGLGERPPLTADEMALLQSSLTAHPDLALFLGEDQHAGVFSANEDGKVEGSYAYIVRNVDTSGLLVVDYAGVSRKGSVRVTARTVGSRHTGVCRRDEPYTWRLPQEGPFPQLVEIRLAPIGKKGRPSPVRIDLGGTP